MAERMVLVPEHVWEQIDEDTRVLRAPAGATIPLSDAIAWGVPVDELPEDEQPFVLDEDVYVDDPNGLYPGDVILVARAGYAITVGRAKELGLFDAEADDDEGDEGDEPGAPANRRPGGKRPRRR